MKGGWFKYILYISLIFLVVALARGNYLSIPEIESPLQLAISILLLFLGFFMIPVYWRQLLALGGVPTTLSRSVSSIGLSIFAKYIPGKIWVILGRAAYIAEQEEVSKTTTSSLSLQAQLISLWVGLLLGGLGLLLTKNTDQFNLGWSMVVIWLGFTLIIFTPWFNQILRYLGKRILKKDINIPVISLRKIIRVIPLFFINWLAWSLAFYFFSQSLVTEPISPMAGLGFALGGTLGILAIIVPGGLGVREGILALYLILLGLDKPTAVTISISSRLWFLVGEVFIFVAGFILSHRPNAKI